MMSTRCGMMMGNQSLCVCVCVCACQYSNRLVCLPFPIPRDYPPPLSYLISPLQVCRKLRKLYPYSCIPVIMVSAKSKEEHVVEGLTAGSNDYVVKPFGRQEILARITAHLRFRDNVYEAGGCGCRGGGGAAL